MLLDTHEQDTLRDFVRIDERMRRIWLLVLVVDLVMAVVMWSVLPEGPVRYLVPVALVLSGAVCWYVMPRVTSGGPAAAAAILAGRDSTTSMDVTALGAQGRAPYTWSFTVDDTAGGPARYVHSAGHEKFVTGQRYRLHGFGDPAKPYRGVVYFQRHGESDRLWIRTVQISSQQWHIGTDT